MKLVEIIRKQSDLHQKGTNAAHGVEKCSGCSWVGWLHAEHHAEMIARAVDESRPLVEFCSDECRGPHYHYVPGDEY